MDIVKYIFMKTIICFYLTKQVHVSNLKIRIDPLLEYNFAFPVIIDVLLKMVNLWNYDQVYLNNTLMVRCDDLK